MPCGDERGLTSKLSKLMVIPNTAFRRSNVTWGIELAIKTDRKVQAGALTCWHSSKRFLQVSGLKLLFLAAGRANIFGTGWAKSCPKLCVKTPEARALLSGSKHSSMTERECWQLKESEIFTLTSFKSKQRRKTKGMIIEGKKGKHGRGRKEGRVRWPQFKFNSVCVAWGSKLVMNTFHSMKVSPFVLMVHCISTT